IGMLRESAGYYRLTERVTAYQHALQDNNLPFRPHYVCAVELNLHGGYAAAKEVLKNEEITANFCGKDEMTMGAYQANEEVRKKILEHISLV
ncbi:LacI family transcriptional regulator, partial [Enterococcus faecium]